VAAFAAPLVGIARFSWPLATAATFLTLPLAVPPVRRILSHAEARELLPALGETSRVVAIYGALLGLGLALG
jgi:1,4-dihydroxy-2-naphthoate octaprenyltransferase